LINTQFGAAAGAFGWGFAQYIVNDRTKINGWCSGLVCGLISVSASGGYIPLWSSLVIGSITSIIVYIFTRYTSYKN
jgi:Amt family ammonium transporter